jgi:hypothetical protein
LITDHYIIIKFRVKYANILRGSIT